MLSIFHIVLYLTLEVYVEVCVPFSSVYVDLNDTKDPSQKHIYIYQMKLKNQKTGFSNAYSSYTFRVRDGPSDRHLPMQAPTHRASYKSLSPFSYNITCHVFELTTASVLCDGEHVKPCNK